MRWGFGIRDDARIKVTRCWGQGCDLINQMWGWFYPPVFRGRTHSCPGSHRSQTFQSSDRGLICTWVGVHIYMCVPKKENRNIGFCKCRMETNKQQTESWFVPGWVHIYVYQRNIGFSKCKMKTNKQTNRELICTWGFYEAKKERFMDDDKNKQKNRQTNKGNIQW